MVAKAEDVKVLGKIVDIARKELDPVEYARFLALITPKRGDTVKQLRELRDKETFEEIVERLKKRGVVIAP
ncbi:MAG: hypothetical protein ABH874_05250 [Methanobacteriota archaeon]|nr:hypothetical protein [Candidatus Hydrothermarchaeota archaeon]